MEDDLGATRCEPFFAARSPEPRILVHPLSQEACLVAPAFDKEDEMISLQRHPLGGIGAIEPVVTSVL